MFEEFGYNPELIRRYVSLFGENFTKELLEANNKQPKKAIRINTLRVTPEKCLNRLHEKGFAFKKVPWCNYSFWLEKSKFSIGATTEILLGYYYLQEPASLIPVLELDPKPTDLVADMTAAPGGKTTHLAQLMQNKGCIIAADINSESMSALRSNLQRMGIENTITIRMDAKELDSLNLKFDKILLDAPCTGEGTIIKDSQRKKSLQVEEFSQFAQLQKDLIKAAHRCLKPGGILVYSTCSLAPEENEENIIFAAEKLGMGVIGLKNQFILPGITKWFHKSGPDYLKKCGRLFPNTHGTQGFFVAKLLKT
jgi:NOL1/NOP2/sun family putative RNA methylase